jgi:toxin HigB-1
MIDGFKHKGLQRLYDADDGRKLPADMLDRLRVLLAAMDEATDIEDLDRPSFKLHKLKGDIKGYWAITVRANWRIVFRFKAGKVLDVDFVDYHWAEGKAMALKSPPHPGVGIRDDLEALGWSVADAAVSLGVTRQQLHNVIAGRSGITPEMALRLEQGIGGTANAWVRLQAAYDLAQVRRTRDDIKVQRLVSKVA